MDKSKPQYANGGQDEGHDDIRQKMNGNVHSHIGTGHVYQQKM